MFLLPINRDKRKAMSRTLKTFDILITFISIKVGLGATDYVIVTPSIVQLNAGHTTLPSLWPCSLFTFT